MWALPTRAVLCCGMHINSLTQGSLLRDSPRNCNGGRSGKTRRMPHGGGQRGEKVTGVAVLGIFLAGAFFGGVAATLSLLCYAIGRSKREEDQQGE